MSLNIRTATANTNPIILIHGKEGKGKTTLALKAPSPVAFLLEPGVPKGVSVDAVDGLDTLDDIYLAIRDLINDPHEFKSLVIDTMDMLEAKLIEHVCSRNGWKTIEQPAYGKGFVIADAEWQRLIRGLTTLRDRRGMSVLMTCHTEVVTVNDPRAPSYGSYQPKLHRRGRGLIMDACDAVLFVSEDLRIVTENERARATASPTRYLFCVETPAFAAKNRYSMPPKIELPIDFPFGELARYWAA